MFGWYVLVDQPLASVKRALLSVPSGGQGHRSRSKLKSAFSRKNRKMLLFRRYIKQMVTNK